jgi:hypothetical protein
MFLKIQVAMAFLPKGIDLIIVIHVLTHLYSPRRHEATYPLNTGPVFL